MQHDLYTWQVLADSFVKDELTNSSEFIDKTITDWLKEVSPKQREEFVDTLFEILNATKAQTLSEISSKWFVSAKAMLTTYKHLDQESKEIMTKTLNAFFEIGKSNIEIKKPSINIRKKEE